MKQTTFWAMLEDLQATGQQLFLEKLILGEEQRDTRTFFDRQLERLAVAVKRQFGIGIPR